MNQVSLTPTEHQRQLWTQLRTDLELVARDYPDAVFASSLAAEDMVLLHALQLYAPGIEVISLDTGRLHAETLDMARRIHDRYQREIHFLRPDPVAVQEHVKAHGDYAFYESVALRQACCQIRKVAPLRLALQGRTAWLSGQRRAQSATRSELAKQEYDASFGLEKFNPLADWSHEDIWAAIHQYQIPYNPLHDQGYPSIGCEPCTRAIRPGEDIRAGRWWWEQRDTIECGLHAANLSHTSNN